MDEDSPINLSYYLILMSISIDLCLRKTCRIKSLPYQYSRSTASVKAWHVI